MGSADGQQVSSWGGMHLEWWWAVECATAALQVLAAFRDHSQLTEHIPAHPIGLQGNWRLRRR